MKTSLVLTLFAFLFAACGPSAGGKIGGRGDNNDDDDDDNGITADEFVDAFLELYCDLGCTADLSVVCDGPIESAPCVDFDAAAAAECLDTAEWTCAPLISGDPSTYPVAPAACSEVCAPTTTEPTEEGTYCEENDCEEGIDEASFDVDCSGDSVTFSVGYFGEVAWGTVDAADTANRQLWNDWHPLDVASSAGPEGEVQPYTEMTSDRLTTGEFDWVSGGSTLFTCRDFFNNDGVMSYLVRLYDADGDLLSCTGFGHDPMGFANGEYYLYNDIEADNELFSCEPASSN
jgi:hypothetical protein